MNDRATPWVLGAVVLSLFGGAAVRRFESMAAKDIRSKLTGDSVAVQIRTVPHGLLGHLSGDMDRVTITAKHFQTEGLPLFTEPDRSKRGKARKLNIQLEDFMLAGLRIDSLTASIPNCRYDFGLATRKGRIRLSQSGVGEGGVTVLAKDLERFILAKFHEIKRVSVHLDHGRVRVEGYGEFLIVKSDFSVDAGLVAQNGVQLMLTDAKIAFGGQPAEAVAAQTLLDSLNPVVDLDKDLHLYGAIQVKRVELEGDRLVASGDTTIPVKPSPVPLPFRLGAAKPTLPNPPQREGPESNLTSAGTTKG